MEHPAKVSVPPSDPCPQGSGGRCSGLTGSFGALPSLAFGRRVNRSSPWCSASAAYAASGKVSSLRAGHRRRGEDRIQAPAGAARHRARRRTTPATAGRRQTGEASVAPSSRRVLNQLDVSGGVDDDPGSPLPGRSGFRKRLRRRYPRIDWLIVSRWSSQGEKPWVQSHHRG